MWKRFWENAWVSYHRRRITAGIKKVTGGIFGGKRNGRTVIAVAGVLVTAAAICGLLFTYVEYRKSDKIYGQAENDYVTVSNGASSNPDVQNADGTNSETTGSSQTDTDSPTAETMDMGEWYEMVHVDLEGLQAAYPDAVGWIYFENESISYPIMYSGDNEKYLRTAYTGDSARAGAIFMDGENTKDFSDPHTLIYGHNMKNLSMFGRLRYYWSEKDYYESHRYFQIFMNGYIYRYEIFAYGHVSADSSIYYVYGPQPDSESLRALLKELKNLSPQESDVDVSVSDHIITLSTCTGDDSTRMIVCAVRVDEYAR